MEQRAERWQILVFLTNVDYIFDKHAFALALAEVRISSIHPQTVLSLCFARLLIFFLAVPTLFSLLLLFVAISNPKGHDSAQATAQIFERVIKNHLGKQIIDCF